MLRRGRIKPFDQSVLLDCVSCTEQLSFSDHLLFFFVNFFAPDLPMATSSGTTPPTVSSRTITSTATAGASVVPSSATAPTVTFASLMSAVEASVSAGGVAVAHALGEPPVLSARSLARPTPVTLPPLPPLPRYQVCHFVVIVCMQSLATPPSACLVLLLALPWLLHTQKLCPI